MRNPGPTPLLLCGLMLMTCGGCAAGDPCEKFNRCVYGFNDGVDRILLRPVSQGYEKVVPRPVRSGIGNFFDNLGYTNVVFNDLLQGRFGDALGGVGRIGVNTTVGLLGTVDVATNWGLPAHRNDMGLTLGRYGAGEGPYLVLPLLGPSTLRDSSDILSRRFTDPLQFVDLSWEQELGIGVVQVMDARTRADWAIRFRDQAAIDPYIFTRDAYLQYRRSLLKLTTQPTVDESFYDDPAGPATRK